MRDEARGDAELVLAVRAGEGDAFGILVERWFDRCWEVAWRILHDHGLAADVAQDTLFTAWRQLDRLDQPGSFGGWLLRISRNRALDRLERERRTMSTGDDEMLDVTAAGSAASSPTGGPASGLGNPDVEVVRSGQQELVWAAAAALGERDASLLDLHLRHGLEPSELADELGITPNAAHQALFRLRSRLGDAIRAWLLWRGGEPGCVVLQAELAAAGVSSFDRHVARLVTSHAEACVACSEERARVTAPAALFGAVPLVLAPTLARAQVLDALRTAGVPVPATSPGLDDAPGLGEGPTSTSDAPGAGPTPDAAGGASPAEGAAGTEVASVPGDPTSPPPRRRGSRRRGEHRSARRTSSFGRVRVPALSILLILLLAGLFRWGVGMPERSAPVADAGNDQGEMAPTDPAVLGPADEAGFDPAAGAGSVSPDDLGGGRMIDGTASGIDPAPFRPPLVAPEEPTGGTDGNPPGSHDLPTAPPPGSEVPEPEDGEHEGPDEEGVGAEQPGEEVPEEPVTEPPTIVQLALTHLGEACELEGQRRPRFWHVAWETVDAAAVHIDLDDGHGPRSVDPTGAIERACVPLGATVELTASNGGGTVTASEQAIPPQ